MLKSRKIFPPGGFDFKDSDGWASTPGLDFDAVVRQTWSHRKANPTKFTEVQRNIDAIAVEVDENACLRCGYNENYCTTEGTNPPFQMHPSPRRGLGVAAAAAGKIGAGAGLLIEWVGGGMKPVAQTLADQRAAVCAKCEFNKKGSAWTDFFTVPMSEKIKAMAELKAGMELATPSDAELSTCSVCLCPLPLKVWVPIDFISAHVKPTTLEELPHWCWIKKESKA